MLSANYLRSIRQERSGGNRFGVFIFSELIILLSSIVLQAMNLPIILRRGESS